MNFLVRSCSLLVRDLRLELLLDETFALIVLKVFR